MLPRYKCDTDPIKYISAEPYSMVPGNRNRVVDLHIFCEWAVILATPITGDIGGKQGRLTRTDGKSHVNCDCTLK